MRVATRTAPAERNQRGIAMVMAVMVLLAISLLSIAMMMTLQVEKKMTGQNARYSQALNVAEAGLAEAMSRIRIGDVPNNLNPRMCAQIFLDPPGMVPVLTGPDSIALATAQPAGTYLAYSSAGKDANVLTVTYKTDPNRTVVYRYDPTKSPPVNPATGMPIFVIRSTGRQGETYRRVQAEVIQKPVNIAIKGALVANVGIDFGGNAQACGYDHRADTPDQTRGVHGQAPAWCQTQGYETASPALPGSWSTSTITSGGSAAQAGSPVNNAQNQLGFYAGPWETVGMTQGEFFSWLGRPIPVMPNGAMAGIYYLDNNSITQDLSGAFATGSAAGEGYLYVDGDLTCNSNFVWRGVIYVEGDLKINGNCWVLGAVIVRGKGRISNGSMVILYSSDAITTAMSKYAGQFNTLSWREVP